MSLRPLKIENKRVAGLTPEDKQAVRESIRGKEATKKKVAGLTPEDKQALRKVAKDKLSKGATGGSDDRKRDKDGKFA